MYYDGNGNRLSTIKNIITTVFGPELDSDATETYQLSSEYLNLFQDAVHQWATEYSGDDYKVPFILHTDQHTQLNASNRGYFDLLADHINWDVVSAIFNLGDVETDSGSWPDDPYTPNVILRNGVLEEALKCLSEIPKNKSIHVAGNHDVWYTGTGASECPVPNMLPDLKYINPYFMNRGLRTIKCPDNSQLMMVYDDYYKLRYLCVASWDNYYRFPDSRSSDRNKAYYYLTAEHWKWVIDQLATDCGYDIVVLSHVPLYMGGPDAYNPITSQYPAVSRVWSLIDQTRSFDAIWNDRKNHTSGSFDVRNTNLELETVSYDFTNCSDDILCSLSGHMHWDAVDYISDEGLLVTTFDDFRTTRSIYFGLIDRLNRQLKVWKLYLVDSVPTLVVWSAPFDKPSVT